MTFTKKDAQRRHAKRRAQQRYGLNINRRDRASIIVKIQSGRATFIEKQSHRISKFMVDIHGVNAVVIYDKLRHEIVTFLPRDSKP